jgi:hypothetical protein
MEDDTFCGIFGGKGIIGVLRTTKGPWRFNTLYLWTAAYISPL